MGLRVVRGDDWQWKDQDGGEGCVGTVVEIGGQGSSKNPDNTVVVLWDMGVRGNYRAGYEGKEDLRVLDNAAAGSASTLQSTTFAHNIFSNFSMLHIVVYYHIAVSGWIITGSRIIQYTIHEIQ